MTDWLSPLRPGDVIRRTITLSEDDIRAGADFLDDQNPIHRDADAAGRFGRVIACGPHIGGIHACMLPTHCASIGLDVLGTTFTTRYVGPVYAGIEHELTWTVTGATAHRSGGYLVDWEGEVRRMEASSPSDAPVGGGAACILTTGQVLITRR